MQIKEEILYIFCFSLIGLQEGLSRFWRRSSYDLYCHGWHLTHYREYVHTKCNITI